VFELALRAHFLLQRANAYRRVDAGRCFRRSYRFRRADVVLPKEELPVQV
jgi:hypothetical protein